MAYDKAWPRAAPFTLARRGEARRGDEPIRSDGSNRSMPNAIDVARPGAAGYRKE